MQLYQDVSKRLPAARMSNSGSNSAFLTILPYLDEAHLKENFNDSLSYQASASNKMVSNTWIPNYVCPSMHLPARRARGRPDLRRNGAVGKLCRLDQHLDLLCADQSGPGPAGPRRGRHSPDVWADDDPQDSRTQTARRRPCSSAKWTMA